MERAAIVSRRLTRLIIAILFFVVVPQAAEVRAHGVTLNIYHHQPADSPFHTQFLLPWKEKLEKESDGHLRIQIHAVPQSGGSPLHLYDQVKDRTADIVWTPVENEAQRFPAFEVFNLPLMTNTGKGSNRALWQYVQANNLAKKEFAGVRLLAVHVSAPRSGETPQLPPEGDLKFALLNTVFIFAMNADAYKSLPDELKKVITANSGAETSERLGQVLQDTWTSVIGPAEGDSARAADLRNRRVQSIVEDRIKELDKRGLNGKELVESARALLAEYDPPN